MTMTCRLYREGHLAETALDPGRISDVLAEPGALLWLDLEGPTEETVALLGREFGFHELALEDSLHPHQRPKIEQYESYFFLVAYGASVADGAAVEDEMAAFVAPNYLAN